MRKRQMTKEEKKNEMKNRISMALKDPILQQGFEIICKENAELKGRTEEFEKQILGLLYKYESVYKRFPDLKDAMDKAERVLKENAELKNRDCWKSCEYVNPKSELIAQHIKDVQQITKAKKIIKSLLNLWNDVMTEETVKALIAETEQFLKEAEND